MALPPKVGSQRERTEINHPVRAKQAFLFGILFSPQSACEFIRRAVRHANAGSSGQNRVPPLLPRARYRRYFGRHFSMNSTRSFFILGCSAPYVAYDTLSRYFPSRFRWSMVQSVAARGWPDHTTTGLI